MAVVCLYLLYVINVFRHLHHMSLHGPLACSCVCVTFFLWFYIYCAERFGADNEDEEEEDP